MWWKLVFNSFRRDRKRKVVAVSAVALATCLATFLLNWSLNLGDKIQNELRAFGSNIIIVPQGEALPIIAGNSEAGTISSDRFLNMEELSGIKNIFWKNQILAVAPLLPQPVQYNGYSLILVGTEFGEKEANQSLLKVAPYLEIRGRWPSSEFDLVAGSRLADQFGWSKDQTVELKYSGNSQTFQITGIVSSGGVEEKQLFARLDTVQNFTGLANQFKQLHVSALVKPPNQLYYKHQRNPDSLTPQEAERFSCTPYASQVAHDIAKVFQGGEPRIVKQVAQAEEKFVRKINWLMMLVSLAGLFAASLTMTSTTTAMILERRKELALMKAVGSSNGFLFLYLFGEILILGTAGSLIGYAIGSLLSVSLSRTLFASVFEVKFILLPVVAAIGVFIILCGSLWPLRQAAALDPAVALRDL
jgi:putative ABC transport system permease protein